MNVYARRITPYLLLAFLLALTVAPAGAQTTMRLVCTLPTVCTPGSLPIGIQTTFDTLPAFSVTNVGTTGLTNPPGPAGPSGTAFLLVLVPGINSLAFTANASPVSHGPLPFDSTTSPNDVYGALSRTPISTAAPDLSAYLSKTNTFLSPPADRYTVYDVSLGAFDTSGTVIPVVLGGIAAFPYGTIFSAFLQDNNDSPLANATNGVPLSSALLIATPEPGTLGLLLAPLAALGIAAMRRRRR